MSGLFSKPSMPAPQPMPTNPMDDPAAIQARQDAERAAIVEGKSRGRASTIAAGGLMAAEEQYTRGLLAQKRRSGKEMMGY